MKGILPCLSGQHQFIKGPCGTGTTMNRTISEISHFRDLPYRITGRPHVDNLLPAWTFNNKVNG